MFSSRFLGTFALMAFSGVLGWTLSEHQRTAEGIPVTPIPAEVTPRSAMQPGGAERPVMLFDDGTVTINVQKRPLQWVFDEIARQGAAHLPASAKSADAGSDDGSSALAACIESPPSEAGERERAKALQAISDGNEDARYQGLLQARSNGAAVSEEILKALVDTDTSERVRLLAFENYLESKSASSADMRAALQSALSNSSAAIQMEARKLLEQLEELERIDANSPQWGTQ
jgi:hypothetical protein